MSCINKFMIQVPWVNNLRLQQFFQCFRCTFSEDFNVAWKTSEIRKLCSNAIKNQLISGEKMIWNFFTRKFQFVIGFLNLLLALQIVKCQKSRVTCSSFLEKYSEVFLSWMLKMIKHFQFNWFFELKFGFFSIPLLISKCLIKSHVAE